MNRATIIQVFSTILVLLLFIPHRMQAQGEGVKSEKQCDNLINKGISKTDAGKFPEALTIFIKAEDAAQKNMWHEQLFLAKNNIGLTYDKLSNYGEALSYYHEALRIAEDYGLHSDIPIILSNIGVTYGNEKDYKTSLEYYQRAYDLARSRHSEQLMAYLAVNISDIYNHYGDYKEARRYLKEVQELPDIKKLQQVWTVNYAETFVIEGKVEEARQMMEKLFIAVDKNGANDCYTCVVELLSKIYDKQNKRDLAISFAKKGLQNTTQLKDKIELYNKVSNLYLKNADSNTALLYKDSVILAKDSLSKVINRGLFETNKVKLRVQEYQNETKSYKEKQEAERTLFIICIIFSIITSFFIYRTLKNRITKQKQEKVIVENQQKIIALELEKRNLELEKRNNENLLLEQQMREKETKALLEQERLKNEIDARNRQLSAKALNLSGRNELIEDIIDSFSQNAKLRSDPALSRHIRDLKKLLKTDDEWESFITHFEEVNNHMLKRIQALHPSLTSNDLRFIAYLYMNLSYKEIAVIFNITTVACGKRKERIAAKMNIPKSISIYNYISGI